MKLEWRDLAIGAGKPIHTSLTVAETEELQRLAAGKRVLEVGSAYGYSTVALALVAEHVTAVDPHQDLNSLDVYFANLVAYGVADKVATRWFRSQQVLPELLAEGERFDLAWIDGDHTDAVVEHDVTWALKLLRPGGVLACHDYLEDTCPGVQVALDRWRSCTRLVDTLAVFEDVS